MKVDLKSKGSVMAYWNSMSDPEKDKWKKAVKECLDENPKLKENRKLTNFFNGWTLIWCIVALATGGVVAALTVPILAGLAFVNKSQYQDLLQCVEHKMSPDSETEDDQPVDPIEESRRKKVIRMTESDLIRLVKKVIKEQSEMSIGPEPVKECLIDNGLDPNSFTDCKEAYTNPTLTTVMACLTELRTRVSFDKVRSVAKCVKEKTKLPIMY
jgi:hypothetical protein